MSEEKHYVEIGFDTLRDGQEVRLTTSEGDIVHGTYYAVGNCLRTALGVVGATTARNATVEAVKIPRDLPTLPGLYTVDGQDPGTNEIFLRSSYGTWMTDGDGENDEGTWQEVEDHDLIPDNLVRFVPDFMVSDYEKRILRAKTLLKSEVGTTTSVRGALLAILDGATNV